SGASGRNSPSDVNFLRSLTTKSDSFFSVISLKGKWQLGDGGRSLARPHDLTCRQFAADVTQRQRLARAVRLEQGGDAGQLAHVLAVRLQLRAGRGGALQSKAGELAVHLAARADALHNLLPHVAALGEVQRLVLLSLLRQVALADVLSVSRNAGSNAPNLERL